MISRREHISRLVPKSAAHLTVNLILVSIVNSATMGYDSSMMNGQQELPQYTNYFHLNDSTRGLNNAVLWIGSFLASLFSPACNTLGRKPTLIFGALITLVGIAIQTAAQDEAMFAVSRIIVGFGTGVANIAGATLVSETVISEQRTFAVASFYTFYYIGSLISACINYGASFISNTWAWRMPSIIQMFASLLCLSVASFIPESPRWLMARGKHEYAREIIAIYCQGPYNPNSEEAHAKADEMMLSLEREANNTPPNVFAIFRGKANRKRLLAMLSFALMVELSGNYEVSYYLTDMLTSAGITSVKAQLQVTVVLQVWCFLCAILGAYLLEKLGRRKQAFYGTSGMIITFYITAALTKYYGNSTNTSGIYATVAMIYIFQGCYSFSISPLTTVYPTELFPFKTRAIAMGIFEVVDSLTGLLAAFVFSFAMQNLGWKFYILNASYDFVFLFAIVFFWIETKGMSLEEITAVVDGVEPEEVVVISPAKHDTKSD